LFATSCSARSTSTALAAPKRVRRCVRSSVDRLERSDTRVTSAKRSAVMTLTMVSARLPSEMRSTSSALALAAAMATSEVPTSYQVRRSKTGWRSETPAFQTVAG
jgi:hypothetical protein